MPAPQSKMRRSNAPFSLWGDTAHPACPSDALTEDVTADVVVVGAGFTGLSAALHLAQAGARVRVLEARSVGSGAAGRSSGFINPGLWAPPSAVLRALGGERGERLLNLLGDAPAIVYDLVDRFAIECDLLTTGTLHCATHCSRLKQLAVRSLEWESRGVSLSILSEGETAALVGSSAYIGSVLNRSGGTLNPLSYARGLARAAVAAGAVIHPQSAVGATERIRSRWSVGTQRGSVVADWIFIASDAYSLGPWRRLRNEQVLLPYFNLATPPLPDELRNAVLPARMGLVDTCRVMNAVRVDGHGRLIVGSVGALRGPLANIHRTWALRFLNNLFPQLAGIQFETETWGQIGLTSNHIPRFHILGPQMLSVSGYNGRGIAAGTLFGKLIAERIAGLTGEDAIPLPRSSPGTPRLRSLKNAAYELGALTVHAVSG